MQSRRFLLWLYLFIISMQTDLSAQTPTELNFNSVAQHTLWLPMKKERSNIQGDNKASLLVLLSPECPMCINYTSLLRKIENKYGNSLQIVGLIPGKTYNDSVVMNFTNSYELDFPVYVDSTMQLSRYLKGEVTPEAFLFDQSGKLAYRGALDNWLSSPGKKRVRADQHYLLDAIEQTLQGDLVVLSYVKPQGCLLNEY
jgi:thioredoxin-related protein